MHEEAVQKVLLLKGRFWRVRGGSDRVADAITNPEQQVEWIDNNGQTYQENTEKLNKVFG